MENKLGINVKEQNWFEKNKSKAVNLFMMHPPRAESGDIVGYNPEENEVILTNYIKRKFDEEGNSEYIESDGELRVAKSNIESYELTNKEDRQGRIKNYNIELYIEEGTKRKNFNNFIRENSKIIRSSK